MKTCPKCNNSMSDYSVFCDICGTKLTEESTSKNKKESQPEEVLEASEDLQKNVEENGRSFFEPVSEKSEDQEVPRQSVMRNDEEDGIELLDVPKNKKVTRKTKVNKSKSTKLKQKKVENGKNQPEETLEYEVVGDTSLESGSTKATEEEDELVFHPVPDTEPSTKLKKKKRKTKAIPKTQPETEPESQLETEPESQPETEPVTQPETEPVTQPETEPESQPEIEPVMQPETEPVTQPETEPVTQPVIEPESQPEIELVTQPEDQSNTPSVIEQVETGIYSVLPVSSSQEDMPSTSSTTFDDSSVNKYDVKIKISFILGIIAVLLGGMWPIAVVGLIIGFLSPENSPRKMRAMLINAIAIALGIIVMIILVSVMQSNDSTAHSDVKYFYGEGYSISYSSPWKETTMTDGRKALKYGDDQSFFYTVGDSYLDITISCDFSSDSCKKETYNYFYDYWKTSIDDNLTLSRESSFVLLKDDLYYATYNYYLQDNNELKGRYYLVISKKKNAILSFIFSGDGVQLAELTPNIVKLLNTLNIETKLPQDKSKLDTLNQTSNWNIYSNMRQDTTGRKKELDGSYRLLADTTSFWVFKNGKFWWYKSEEALDDNYWYGTYQVKKGKTGFKSVDLDEDIVDKLIQQANGKITEDDIYAVQMVPTKIIYDGVDKSSTIVRKGTKWRFVWIIVDHGDDGIEAQVFNADTYDVSYFVKVSDSK